jgi:hypothetical protein
VRFVPKRRRRSVQSRKTDAARALRQVLDAVAVVSADGRPIEPGPRSNGRCLPATWPSAWQESLVRISLRADRDMLQCGNEVVNGESRSAIVSTAESFTISDQAANDSKSWMPLLHAPDCFPFSRTCVYAIEQFVLQVHLKFSNFAIRGTRCTGW